MKKLLILTALTMLTISATGCGQLRAWWNRGAACNACSSDVVYEDAVVAPTVAMPVLPNGAEVLPTP